MKNIKSFAILLFSLFLLIVSNVYANQEQNYANAQPESHSASYQALDEIHELVTNHVKQKIDQKIFDATIQLRKLTPELKIPKCLSNLELVDKDLSNISGRMTISVFCQQPKWRVFVPVTVKGKQPVVISTNGILKRAVIKESDVKQTLMDYKAIPSGGMIDVSKVIGMRAKKAIPPNTVIKVRDLQPPYWVFKNKQVNIITRIGGIEVKTRGTALESGVADEQVPIRNNTSEKIIKGIVVAPNTVLVP
ncbi:MAG: flagellar basal body P-ring formation chaperone FlgA [Thiomicrorhabdus sp.]|nr:flagellar basal body P-ring formation chaperone FlgA [Thiomicrorhabdus sp.]